MSLNDDQLQALLAPLSPGRVRSLSGNSHLEAWDIRRWLIRIFGWGGWSLETLECTCISERSVWNEQNPLNGRHTVVYRVQVRLIIKGPNGVELAHFDDGATGDGINQPSLQKAHDFALKTAMSQALKRVAVNCGDTFGLSLYDRGKAGETTVGRSLAHSVTTDHVVREDVRGGEMDEQQDATLTDTGSPPVEPVEQPLAAPGSGSGAVESLPAAPEPTPEEAQAALAAQVELIRDRVFAAMKMKSRNDALMKLTRINLDAAQAGLQQQMTNSPAGEPMTVAVLLDTAIKLQSRSGS